MKNRWSPDLYTKAYLFASKAHHGQKMPGSDLPYTTHLTLVSMEVMHALMAESGFDGDLAVQCAVLHDVIEDTATTYQDVESEFGKDIADGVLALSKNPQLDKAYRMVDSLARIKAQPQEIWMVKMADRITNLIEPPHYWTQDNVRRYRMEAMLIYESLCSACFNLSIRLKKKIEKYQEFISEDI